jgi:DNA-binding FrmR family transcriptional regulator
MDNAAIQGRLRRIEGQVQGIQRMLDDDRACEDVLTQMLAIRSAVEKVCLGVTERHVRDCVFSDLDAGDPRIEAMEKALKLWVRAGG